MTRKTLKIVVGFVAILLVALTAGVVVASTKDKAALPEYLGSETCIGCHADKFVNWETSLHANFVKEIKSVEDLPADPTGLAPELAAELAKAKYYFHDRFLTPNLKTGELMYLGIEYNETTKQYVAAPNRVGTSFDASCGGCHAGKDYQSGMRASIGVGCESCHGAGRDHILGKGDVSKIYSSVDPSTTCASCHSGYNQAQGASRFPVGYRPGMKLEEVGFVYAKVDASKTPTAMHHKGAYPQWEVSAHGRAAADLNASDHGQDRCYECHSTTFIEAQEAGQPISPTKDHKVYDGVTCVTCHDPHGSTEPYQLRKDAQSLCTQCHTGEIAKGATFKAGTAVHHPNTEMLSGYGAVGIAQTQGAHSEVTCVECHMTGGNHLMGIVKPEDVIGTTQKDTCTSCHQHENSTPESRAAYLESWQTTVTAKLADLKKDTDVIDAALKANPKALPSDVKAKYDAAKTNISMVDADGSKGAHNFEYAIKILAAAKKDVSAARTLVK